MKALFPLLLLAAAPPAKAPAPAAAAPSQVEIVLDASGSMNARTKDGTRRIDAAKAAVKTLAGATAPTTKIALRAYGHRSPKETKDCDDIELLTPFAPAKEAAAEIAKDADALTARGYTPIQRSLKLAAADFPKDGKPHAIVLVSDGKETCDADPCAEAARLVATDKSLVIHAVGFDVDDATRTQLTCIARVAGGKYFEAKDAGELAKALGEAAVAPKAAAGTTPAKGQGSLRVTRPDTTGHDIVDANGKVVARIDPSRGKVEVPAGIYSVTFGGPRWSGVEVKRGETTTLDPGEIAMKGGASMAHQVIDAETGTVVGEMSPAKASVTLLPGVYDVSFGGATWKDVRVEAGKTTTLAAAYFVLGKASSALLLDPETETVVGGMNAGQGRCAVPPGTWIVDANGEKQTVTIGAGESKTVP